MKKRILFELNHLDQANVDDFNKKIATFLNMVIWDFNAKKYSNVEFLVEKNGEWRQKGKTDFNFYKTDYRIVNEVNIKNIASEIKRFKRVKNKETGEYELAEHSRGDLVSYDDVSKIIKGLK